MGVYTIRLSVKAQQAYGESAVNFTVRPGTLAPSLDHTSLDNIIYQAYIVYVYYFSIYSSEYKQASKSRHSAQEPRCASPRRFHLHH